jgi:hypothetical protein
MAAVGGCEGSDVYVGQVQEGLNLDVCVGDGIQCGGNAASGTLTASAVRNCEGELGPELEVDFTVDPAESVCASGSDAFSCMAQPLELAVGPDGSSWVLGVTQTRTEGTGELLWVSHFDAAGEPLGVTDIASGVPFNGGEVQHHADITVDERGHVFVVVYQIDGGPNADAPLAERAWLSELDPRGRPVQGPVFLAGIGVSRVAVAQDGNVVIAANALQNARHGVLAALTPSGDRLWSQNNVRTSGQGVGHGVSGLAAGASGEAFVLAEVSRDSAGDPRHGLTRFDASGNATWDRTFDPTFDVGDVVAAGDGNVLIGTRIHVQQHLIWHVLANGTVSWTYAVEGLGRYTPVLDEGRQRAYVTGLARDRSKLFVASITLDGESCERYALPDDSDGGVVAYHAEHGLYFLGQTLRRMRFSEE